MDPQEMEKKLNLMRYWLFGAFAIIFAGATVYMGLFMGAKVLTTFGYWLAVIIMAGLCVGTFYLYKWILSRK